MPARQTEANRPARMTPALRERVEAELSNSNDLTNPTYLFSLTATELLLAIVAALIDPMQLARRELANRGLDLDGLWIGFPAAKRLHLGDQKEES